MEIIKLNQVLETDTGKMTVLIDSFKYKNINTYIFFNSMSLHIYPLCVYVCADLYGFEHALSVVERPQVFGDVEAHRANGSDEM